MKRQCIILVFEGMSRQAVNEIASDLGKVKALKKYEMIISNDIIKPLDTERVLELCRNLLEVADRLNK